MTRQTFYLKLARMQGLEVLKLGSLSGGWKTLDMEQTVLDGIGSLKNLQELSLNYDCTDKILKLLVENCPKLVSLDISNSKFVNNQSVEILVDLKYLKVVHLYRTAVSMEGYINMLLHLPDLLDVGRYDELGRVLEYIDDYHPTWSHFQLAQFISLQATTKQIHVLAQKCPNVQSISLFHNVLLLDLMALIGLNQLKRLKLLSCDFFADQIRDVLEVKGCNITYLNLEHVDELDMNALIYISQFCPDLKTLILCNCNLIESTSLYYRKHQIPPYMNLENLTLVGHCRFQHIEFILCNAFKIKFVHFGTQIETNDALFEKIFLRNQLCCLEDMRILHSDYLSIKTVYSFINNCENLIRLNEIECWQMVLPYEFEELKNYIRDRNLDLDITSYRKFMN